VIALVISPSVHLEKDLWKKDLEILKYHYSYGCKGTNLETFEKSFGC
jgi:hypothetical protein